MLVLECFIIIYIVYYYITIIGALTGEQLFNVVVGENGDISNYFTLIMRLNMFLSYYVINVKWKVKISLRLIHSFDFLVLSQQVA